ncbi:MAG: ABC transporter ATP-binding protein [Actinomycetes bacterium]
MTKEAALVVDSVDVFHGYAQAIHSLSLTVEKGVFATLLGPNGAGKSTLLRSIMGILPAKSGHISFEGKEITKRSPNQIAAGGIALVPEGRKIFQDQTVQENLLLGGYLIRRDATLLAETLDLVYTLFPILADRRQQNGGTLSGGEAQMLAVARALMVRPRMLLLDEPSLGLAPQIVMEIMEHLKRLNETQGLSILLVEQTAQLALQYSSHAFLVSNGRMIVDGKSNEMKTHPEVTRVYFGG